MAKQQGAFSTGAIRSGVAVLALSVKNHFLPIYQR